MFISFDHEFIQFCELEALNLAFKIYKFNALNVEKIFFYPLVQVNTFLLPAYLFWTFKEYSFEISTKLVRV